MAQVPQAQRWLFWDVSAAALETTRDADYIVPRVLEFGRLVDVRWLIATYGLPGIHRFLRDVGHTELSDRTIRFWRVTLKTKDETWASPPAWRKSNAAPWIA